MKSDQIVRNIKSFRSGIHSVELCGSNRIKIIREYLSYSIALHRLPLHSVHQFFMAKGTLVICLSKQRCMEYQAIRSLMDAEDPRIALAFEAKELYGDSVKTIAADLSVSEPRVYQLIKRAKAIGRQFRKDNDNE